MWFETNIFIFIDVNYFQILSVMTFIYYNFHIYWNICLLHIYFFLQLITKISWILSVSVFKKNVWEFGVSALTLGPMVNLSLPFKLCDFTPTIDLGMKAPFSLGLCWRLVYGN